MERLNPYLTKTFEGDGVSFTCNGWEKLFSISEPVFMELCIEFFATVSFQENTEDPYYTWALVFCLGGEYQKWSFVEFSWRMG